MSYNISGIAGLIPSSSSTDWIIPWIQQVLDDVKEDQSPYAKAVEVIHGIFYPKTVSSFSGQLWFLMGLFGLSTVIILLGLVLRLRQGRFWLLHRIDSTIVIPNISTIYGLCALAYAALGMLTVVTAVRIAENKPFPSYWVGLQAGWIGPLWTGIYCEGWATLCAWYIRKKGAFYKESRFKTVVAVTLPFLLPLLAWGPPVGLIYVAAHRFNAAIRGSGVMISALNTAGESWTPGAPLNIAALISFFPVASEFGYDMIEYYKYVRIGYIYITAALAITFVVYISGALLEIAHLNTTIHKLREQAKLTPRQRAQPTFLSPQPEQRLNDEIEDELYAGQRRQWTLLAWARNNRIYSAFAIGLMLLVNAALAAWLAATPISITVNSSQFQVEILVACWLNSILSTAVSLLILFRSLDGSSPTVCTLRRYLPFLPLPPAISISHPSRATHTTHQGKGEKTTTGIVSKFDEPPKYGGGGGAVSPILEERKTPRGTYYGPADEALRSFGGGEDGRAESIYFTEDLDGLGVSGAGLAGSSRGSSSPVPSGGAGSHVVLEMREVRQPTQVYDEEASVEYEEPPRFGGHDLDGHLDDLPYRETHRARFADDVEGGEEELEVPERARQDSWAALERDGAAKRDSWD
ncbi:hypothetical protein JCM10207_005126 [Rhodosporidiobolus poonsookiae]